MTFEDDALSLAPHSLGHSHSLTYLDYTCCMQTSWTNVRGELPTTKQGKLSYQYVSSKILLQSNNVLTSILYISICDDTCIQIQLKMKRHFTKAFLMPVNPLETDPETSKTVRQFVIKRVNACIDSGGGYFEHPFFTVVPCILILSKFFHQLMH